MSVSASSIVAGDEVRKAARGVRRVLAPLERDDLELVGASPAPGLRRRAHPRRRHRRRRRAARVSARRSSARAGERVFGFVDDPAHEIARRDQLVDRADALARRVALLVGVDVGCSRRRRGAARSACDRAHHLLRERSQLLGMLLDVLRPLVAHGAQRLAREPAADDRAVLGRAQQRFLVAAHGARLGRRDEARARATRRRRRARARPRARGRRRCRPRRRPARRSPTASTICGTSGIVATVPVCPPASVPCAITKSQPASTAAIAWRTLPHMLATSTLPSCSTLMTSRGTPRPATNNDAPPFTICCASSIIRSGSAASRSTPNGLSVQVAHRAHLFDRARRTPSSPRRACRSRPRRRPRRRRGGTRRRPSRPASRGARCRASRSVVSAWLVHGYPVRFVGRDANRPLVGVIMGSDSDLPVMQGAIDVLAEFGVAVRGADRLRAPHARRRWPSTPAPRPSGACRSSSPGPAAPRTCPGMTASMTPLPVIGVPVPLAAARRPRLAAVDRADAGRHPGRHRRGRQRQERGPARGAHPRHRRRRSCAHAMERYQADLAATVRDKDADVRAERVLAD